MNPADIRSLIESGGLATPCEVVTRGGRVYMITDPRNAWLPEAYPDTLVIASKSQGLALVGLGTIEAILLEKEAVR